MKVRLFVRHAIVDYAAWRNGYLADKIYVRRSGWLRTLRPDAVGIVTKLGFGIAENGTMPVLSLFTDARLRD